MELSSCNDLCELLHVGWFDIHNVKALVLDIKVPEVYSQVITADEGLPITVDRNAIDMVGMRVGVGSSRNSGYNGIMMCESWKFEIMRAIEVHVCVWS